MSSAAPAADRFPLSALACLVKQGHFPAFKAYDIRAIYGQDLTEALAYWVGRALPALLCREPVAGVERPLILVGRDMRLSSPALAEALIAGITEAGADVLDLGLSTTPMVYFFTAEGDGIHALPVGSVMVTASHNPKEYNGLKVSLAGAKPCGYELGLKEIEAALVAGRVAPAAATPGRVIPFPEARARYVTWLKAHTPNLERLANLRFAVDCSNGAAALLARDLFGPAALYLNEAPDGTFPNHGPNPLEPENRRQLVEAVQENALDFGILFDGDADRVAFVDHLGRFVPPDAMIPLFARLLGQRGDVVVHDVRTSRGVIESLREDGFEPLMVKVGAAFAKTALRERGGLCGGEVAGHYYFRDFHFCDSGAFAACLALGMMAQAKAQGQTLADLLAPITSRYVSSGEVNIHGIENRAQAIDTVVRALLQLKGEPQRRIDFDGVRLDWADGWFGVRASNTEPILRLAGEAPTQAALAALLATAKAALA